MPPEFYWVHESESVEDVADLLEHGESDGGEPDDGDLPMRPSFRAIAEMAGWWPGVGCMLLPKEGTSGENADELTVQVRRVSALEEEFFENFADADSGGSGISMMTGSTRRFLSDLAEAEIKKCRYKKRRGPGHQIADYLYEQFPDIGGAPYKPPEGKKHLTERIVGYSEETGEPDVEIGCCWTSDELRNKIQKLVQSRHAGVSVAEFCRQIEAGPDAFRRFMTVTDNYSAKFFFAAARYFAKKEEGFIPVDKNARKGKKRKSSSNDDGDDDGDDGNHDGKKDGDAGSKGSKKGNAKSNKKARASAGDDNVGDEPGVVTGTKTKRKTKK